MLANLAFNRCHHRAQPALNFLGGGLVDVFDAHRDGFKETPHQSPALGGHHGGRAELTAANRIKALDLTLEAIHRKQHGAAQIQAMLGTEAAIHRTHHCADFANHPFGFFDVTANAVKQMIHALVQPQGQLGGAHHVA